MKSESYGLRPNEVIVVIIFIPRESSSNPPIKKIYSSLIFIMKHKSFLNKLASKGYNVKSLPGQGVHF